MKRKASELDEVHITCDWPPTASSNASSASPESNKTTTSITWRIPSIPYFHTRTRKRYRDGRPDEDVVHQKTIARLFEAQKQLHTNEIAEQQRTQHVDSYLMSLDIPEHTLLQDPEPKQKSIDSFFGTRPQRQPQRQSFFSFAAHPTPSYHMLACEDCNTSLHKTAGEDAMDIDMMGNDLSCASCSKIVCDMCAVRGDARICLECAEPGGGI